MLILLIGFVWGLSEATLFFLVPDIWLTWVVLHHNDKIIPTYLWTLAGAMLGGTTMYLWGIESTALLKQILDAIPAISHELIKYSAESLKTDGFLTMLSGSFRGTPYKLYASQAYEANISLTSFIMMTIPSRLARWSVLGLITWQIKKNTALQHQRRLTQFWMIAWFVNYVIYFSIMEN